MSGWDGSTDASGVIAGDPEDLRARARNYEALADRLEQAGHDMRGHTIPNWQGQSADGYDTFRQRGSQNYFTAAQAAHDNAALLTTRAQSIEDNRRIVNDASTIRANSTDATRGQPEEGPLWQTHLDTVAHADAQIASAHAADAESASRTATQAAALHQQLPATRLLADSSLIGEFDLTAPPAAPAASPPVIVPDPPRPPPAAAPRVVPAPRAAPPPTLGSGPGGGATAPGPGRSGGGGDAGGGSGDGTVPAPPSGGSTGKGSSGSTGSESGPGTGSAPTSDAPAPSGGPVGSHSPSTNPAALTPNTSPGSTPGTAAPSLPAAGAGVGPTALNGPGVLPAASSPYYRLGSPYNPLPGQISRALNGPAVLPPLNPPVDPPIGAAPGLGSPSTPDATPPGATPPGGAPPAGGGDGGAPARPGAPLGGSGTGAGGTGQAPQAPPVPGDPPPMAPPVPAGPDQGSDGGSLQSPPDSGQPPTVPPDRDTTPPGAQPDAGAPPGSAAGSPLPGHRPGSPAPAGHFGVIVGAGIALAGGVVALLVRARGKMEARQRSRYRAGSGRRDVLPTPPAVRSMTRAHHTNPHRDHLDHHTDLQRPPAYGPTSSTAGTDTPPEPDAASGPAPRREPLARPVWPVGMRGEQPVALDLAVGSVAFTGPGAADAIRALIVATLAGVAGDTAPGRVIMSAAETAELFGFDHTPLPEGAIITADQTASLTLATTFTTHTVGDPLDDGPVLLIINTMRGAQLDTARPTLARLTAAGIGVLILGDHPEGALCDINTDHIVTAAYGPAAEHLHGATMFELTLEHLEGTLSPLTAEPHRGGTDGLEDTHPAASAGSGPDGLNTARHGADLDGTDLDGTADAVTEVRAAASGHDASESDSAQSGMAGEVPTGGQPGQAGSRKGWHEGLIRHIGTRNNQPLNYDLGAFAGLGLTGPGAPAALRALWSRLLDPTTTDPSLTPAEVIIPIDTADALLGEPDPNPNPDGDRDSDRDGDGPSDVPLLGWPGEVDDLDAALQRLETEIITRARAHYATPDTTAPSPCLPSASVTSPASSSPPPPPEDVTPIVLITHSPEDLARPEPDPAFDPDPDSGSASATETASMAQRWTSRLGEISERGAALGIAVVVLGHWAHGTNCHLDANGQITTATGPGGFILREATLHQLDTDTARAAVVHGPPSRPAHDTPANPEPANLESARFESATQESAGQPSGEASLTDATDHTPHLAAPARDGDSHSAGAGLDSRGEAARFAEPQPAQAQTDPHTGAASDQTAPPAPVPAPAADEVGAAPEQLTPVRPDRQPDHTGADPDAHSTGSASADTELSVSTQVSAPVALDTEPIPAAPPSPPQAHELDSVPAEALLVVLVLGPLAVYARPAPAQPLREITGRLSPTQRLILAALAASTDPVHTDTLLHMCFAGGDKALHRLQSNITRLRAALRAAIGHDTATKLIAHTAGRYHLTNACWVDHHTLHTQLHTAATTVDEPDQYARRWAGAFALYRGPLLDGLEYDIDTDWLAPHREHTLRTMIDLARQLAEHLTPTHPAQAAGYLSTALRLEPHNEDTARHLITHHLAHGHRHAAEQVLAQLTRNLADIDASPQPRTVALLADSTRPDTTP